jgi:hypothetical protein
VDHFLMDMCVAYDRDVHLLAFDDLG